MNKQKLLNTHVDNLTMQEAIHKTEDMIISNKKSYVVAVNVDVIIKMEKDNYLKKISDEADMVLVDGKPLIWIAKIHKRRIKEKISGSDFVPELCKLAELKKYTIFIIGGKQGIAEKAKTNLESTYNAIEVVGTYSPEFGFENDEMELNNINNLISKASPDIVIACFGCPKQEKWVYENYEKYNAKVTICAGATVDFLAGNIKRAPKWMSDHGLEWLFRFINEPKRLFKRYFWDDIHILKLMFKYK